MTDKKRCRSRCTRPRNGKGKEKSSFIIVRQSGYPVNGIFSCRYLREVYEMLARPIQIKEIAQRTHSTIDRVWLAIHDLDASGVRIRRTSYNGT